MLDNKALLIRNAVVDDLEAIITLLATDVLGQTREANEVSLSYQAAFAKITEDPNADLLVLIHENDIIGTAQVNYLANLTYQGGTRAQVEGVRISEQFRGQGLGEYLFTHIKQRALERECHLIQLTTDKRRPEAIEFYQKLGFTCSHEGMKYHCMP